ncbi:MAG: hypothetical protein Q7K03_08980 [Dehalococcoidia bacterium]|nr:hypothetical protein [Dehalococcoidia bacterium]
MERGIPERMVFNCEAEGFSIYDAQEIRNLVRSGRGEPWLELRCGPGNIFESRPVRVVGHRESTVSVQCADGAVVHLDLEEGTVRKEVGNRLLQYLGVIQEGNEGRGYI